MVGLLDVLALYHWILSLLVKDADSCLISEQVFEAGWIHVFQVHDRLRSCGTNVDWRFRSGLGVADGVAGEVKSEIVGTLTGHWEE